MSFFVTSSSKLSNNLLYPSGAFVSSILIVSFEFTSVISIVPKVTFPSVSVVFVSASFPGSVTLNSAFGNFTSLFSLSTFTSCRL